MVVTLSQHPLVNFITDLQSMRAIISILKKQHPQLVGIIISDIHDIEQWKKIRTEATRAGVCEYGTPHVQRGAGFEVDGIVIW